MRLVGPNGEQVGIVRVEDALRLAAEADLDLVEVAPMAKPPVAKLMDFGKYKYEAALKAREARKNQVNTVIKEIKLRPKIDPHDYETKKGHVVRFLSAGDKVKVTIMFRGREQSRPELGFRLLQRLAQDVVELGFVESQAKQDGRNMIMVLGPTKKKAEAKAEQRKKRDQAGASAAAMRQPRHEGEAPTTSAVEPAVDETVDVDTAVIDTAVMDTPVEETAELAAAPEAPAVAEQALESPEVTDAAPAPEAAAPAPVRAPAPARAPAPTRTPARTPATPAPAPATPAATRAAAAPAGQKAPATEKAPAAEQPAPAPSKPASAPVPTPPKPRPAPPKDTPKPRPGSGPVPAPPRSRAKA